MPQEDKFAGHPNGLSTLGVDWLTLTPHDTNPLPFYPKAVVCGATAGTVVCISRSGATSTFWLEAGQTLPVRPNIITTASTATPLIGLKE
ncbi:MAG TPA: hypothetical protein VK540_32435 [Polyangiaceae bacterium]|nr:hypothetical protein [Polyangiaceae bacterium]